MIEPITLHSWPRAIAHIDGDAFFASCEQAADPALKGKPVITGKERGIVAAASYEAKARGVTRAMRLFEAKKLCPDIIMLPSDYELYSLFSVRMFEIFRRFTPDVEEYSIDEAFADLTGLRRTYHKSYGGIAADIQTMVEKELGLSVSIGVSITKVLAKIASKFAKPKGLTIIPGREIHNYLAELPVGKVWGIGPNTAALLKKFGISTTLDFAGKDICFVEKHLSKPYMEVWNELNGRSVYPVSGDARPDYKSISKIKTFTPPSNDKSFVFAQLSKNLENACIKARRHNLAATRLIALLRRNDFKDVGLEIKLNRSTAYPAELLTLLKRCFDKMYRPDTLYRSTSVALVGLVRTINVQYGLFDDIVKIEKMSEIYNVVDKLSEKFGKHTIRHASSIPTKLRNRHEGAVGDIPRRKTALLKGESKRRRLNLPMLNIKV